MEKYRNGRVVVRRGGRFAKQPTLAALGFDLSDGKEKTCRHYGNKQNLISTNWRCQECKRFQEEGDK